MPVIYGSFSFARVTDEYQELTAFGTTREVWQQPEDLTLTHLDSFNGSYQIRAKGNNNIPNISMNLLQHFIILNGIFSELYKKPP